MNIRLAIFTAATAFISVGSNMAAAQPVPSQAAGTSVAAVEKTEANPVSGLGSATGMGRGGGAGSASSLAGGFGSAGSGSGAGSQTFGGGFNQQQTLGSGPLARSPLSPGGGPALRP